MANSKKAKKAPGNTDQSHREVWGICLIALGLFLGASIYSDAVGLLGKAISGFFFGAFGIVGYVIPLAIAAFGVLAIIYSETDMRIVTFILILLAIFSLLSVIHLSSRPDAEGVKVLVYYRDAYDYGNAYRQGGGMIGALLAYPALLLMGTVGSYIVFIACILISFLLITRLSIKRAGEKIGEGIKTGVDAVSEHMSERRQRLYTEELSSNSVRKKKPAKRAAKKNEPIEDDPFVTIYSPQPEKKHANSASGLVRDTDGELDFMPSTGRIKRRKADEVIERAIDDVTVPPDAEPDGILINDFLPGEDELPPIDRISRNAPKAEPAMKTQTAPLKEEQMEEVKPLDSDTTPAPLAYQRPPFDLLNMPEPTFAVGAESPQEKGKLLIDTLATFNISARIVNISVGPVITRFELQPAQGVRVNRITSLSQDLALALAASRVRIEAPIPGKAAIGIEIPNKSAAKVLLREIVESREFQGEKSAIAFALGKDIAGKVVTADLDKMPHLLIAGSTGSGKSVCMNDIILSMAYKSTPDDVRMILIDPKVVEMRMYAPLPHLLLPVVTDPKKAASALKWAVLEMEQRYRKMSERNARDLARYNAIAADGEEKLPKIVIIIDELADLMMVAAKDVEESICRIAQLGRAAGIHLIVATQRPSTDVITGLIKANIPSRIAFAVSSGVDSRVIMDENGAEKLLGKGDMLFHPNGASKPQRAQAALVTDEEVERVMDFFTDHKPECAMEEDAFERINAAVAASSASGAQGNGKQEDELLPEAVKIVLDSGQASITMIQRRLRVGYARAARLIDIMEQHKIVTGFDGSKARKLLIDHADYERMFGGAQGADSGGESEE